jgi:hypothetical protein
MVVAGLGDRLTPPAHSVELWEHWHRPALRWFPGSHILHFERSGYLDAMWELMATARAGDGVAADGADDDAGASAGAGGA